MRQPWKTEIQGADLMCQGRVFQMWAAATGKALSPMVDSCVQWTFSINEKADQDGNIKLTTVLLLNCNNSSNTTIHIATKNVMVTVLVNL